jgi:fructokinase
MTAHEHARRSQTGSLRGGIELGGTKALCAVGADHEHILAEARIENRAPEQVLNDLVSFFAPYRETLTAVGVASFGPLELSETARDTGCFLRTPKPGWSGFPLRAALREALQVPVAIETDVGAAAIAEQRWGSARGADPCVYITVGTGIGVGVVIDGKPLHGLMHPELGHLPIQADASFAGVCPFHGNACLEGVASAPALHARLGVAPESIADEHPVWKLEARYLAQLVSTCVLAYAPRRIVMGGGVLARRGLMARIHSEAAQILCGYIPRAELAPANIASYIVAPHFGERAGLMGAFALLS